MIFGGNNGYNKPASSVPAPAPVPVNNTKLLEDLFNELGSMKWISKEPGFEKAVSAVRKRIVELVDQNK